jgi:apoptosis-inducing factor 3
MSDSYERNPVDLTQWTDLEAAPDGKMLAGSVGKDRVFVSRSGHEVMAYGNNCPHLGAPLDEGVVSEGIVHCPWHHACFDLATGEAIAAPAFNALTRYPVIVEDGRFVVKPATTLSTRPRQQRDPTAGTMAIVGGGAAGFAAADQLRKLGWRGFVELFSTETEQPYDRTLLTKDYLEGALDDDRLAIAQHSLDDLDVAFHGGVSVERIDPPQRRLSLANGREYAYTKLLLATGAAPRRLDFPGSDLPNVMLLRSLGDCRRILANVVPGGRVVVIGGSFIAMEAAASLRGRGLSIDVVAPEPHPLEKVLGRELSDLIVDAHLRKGVRLHLGAKVERVEEQRVILQNGHSVEADIVIVGAGVEPRVDLAKEAGLAIDGGVLVNSRLQTSDPHIFAAGDIVRWPDPYSGKDIRVEHWAVAERQGQVAAANMLGHDKEFTMVPFFWTKHFDLSIRYVGHADKWDEIAIEGDLAKRDALVRFRMNGRDLAIATVERDADCLRAAIAMGHGGAGNLRGDLRHPDSLVNPSPGLRLRAHRPPA